MRLDNVLTREEMKKFLDFVKQIGSTKTSLCDGLASTLTGKYVLNVIKLDGILGRYIPQYNADGCKYKGKPASCADVVRAEFGEEIEAIIIKLLGDNNGNI